MIVHIIATTFINIVTSIFNVIIVAVVSFSSFRGLSSFFPAKYFLKVREKNLTKYTTAVLGKFNN